MLVMGMEFLSSGDGVFSGSMAASRLFLGTVSCCCLCTVLGLSLGAFPMVVGRVGDREA